MLNSGLNELIWSHQGWYRYILAVHYWHDIVIIYLDISDPKEPLRRLDHEEHNISEGYHGSDEEESTSDSSDDLLSAPQEHMYPKSMGKGLSQIYAFIYLLICVILGIKRGRSPSDIELERRNGEILFNCIPPSQTYVMLYSAFARICSRY